MSADTVVAGAALLLTGWSMYETRRHNKLSVRPLLVTDTNRSRGENGQNFTLNICNRGIGPAKIMGIFIYLDGKELRTEKGDPIENFLAARLGGKVKYDVLKTSWPRPPYAILPGAEYRLAEVFVHELKREGEEAFDAMFKDSHMLIEYESFYGERFTLGNRIGKELKPV